MGNAVGLLHEEMRRLGSLVMAMGDRHKLPAGGALAVDRDGFAAGVTEALAAEPLVTLVRAEVAGLPPAGEGLAIVATGPLTSPALAEDIRRIGGQDQLAFFDAIAPIVHKESVDLDVAWFQSRYDKEGPGGGTADYSTARWIATSTRRSSTRCWPARRATSRRGKPRRPISRAACRSR